MFIFNVNLGNPSTAPYTKATDTRAAEVKMALTMLAGSSKLSKLANWLGQEQARIANLADGQQYCCDNIVMVTGKNGVQSPEFQGLMHLGAAGALSFPILTGLTAMGKKIPGAFPGWATTGATPRNEAPVDETLTEAEAREAAIAAARAMVDGPKKVQALAALGL